MKKGKSPQKSTLDETVQEIGFVGALVSILIAIPTLSLPALATYGIERAGSAEADWGQMFVIFLKTVPLTLTFMIVGFALSRDMISTGWPLVFLIAAALTLNAWIFDDFGMGKIEDAWKNRVSGNPALTFTIKLLSNYFLEYQWVNFCSSIVVGLFGGWAIHHFSWKVIENK